MVNMNSQLMDTDNQEVTLDHDHEEPNEKVEKMKRSSSSSSPSKSTEVYAEPIIAVRECNICGKTFSNGKALGGHRRSHFQAAKKHSQQKVKTHFSNPPKRSNNKAFDDDDDEGKHTCYLCQKDFPSKNALFGHMRSHPERDWRGVCPPTIHTPSCSLGTSDSMEKYKESDCDDDFVGKDKASLPRWQKTDKRGRRSIGAYEAAEILVYIRCNYFCAESEVVQLKDSAVKRKGPETTIPSSSEKHVLKKKKKIKFYVSGSLRCENKNDGGGDCDSDNVNREKGSSGIRDEKVISDEKEEADWAKEKYCVKNTTEVMQDDAGICDEKKKKKKKQKGKKIKKLLSKPKTPQSESEDKAFVDKTEEKLNGYECDICWKCFPTFQALGGHKSIHNKEKNIAEDNTSKDSDVRGVLVVMEEEANNVGTETLIHEEGSSSQFVAPKILDFDLNKSPDDMHDD